MSITIELSRGKLPYITHEEDGVKTSKYVYADQVIDMITSSMEEKKAPKTKILLSSPALPPRTVKYALGENETHYLFTTEEETSCNIQYNSFVFEEVPYPKMVFGYKISGQSLIIAYCAVYNDLTLRDTTKLYRFPYSNVHSGGKLCYWSNEPVKDLVQLQTFAYQWREVPNNDHIYIVGQTNQTGDTLYNVYKSLAGKPFDNSILTPMGMTFGQWSEQIMKS